MPTSVVWGVGVGLVIAAIDTASLVLMGMTGASQYPISDADFMANVVLYSLIGFRVGKATGVVRDAAESGVLAGVVVATVGIAATYVIRPATGGLESTGDVVSIVAQNVAIGGVLAIVAGWIGARANQDRTASRR